LDLFKRKAAFMGGFAVVLHVTDDYLDVVFAETVGGDGEAKFTDAFSKPLR
jgi:cytolysin (calcineurin-like family phosphatase)